MQPYVNDPAKLILALHDMSKGWIALWIGVLLLSVGLVAWWAMDEIRRGSFRLLFRLLGASLLALCLAASIMVRTSAPYQVARAKVAHQKMNPRAAYLDKDRPNPVDTVDGDPYPFLGVLTLALLLSAGGETDDRFFRRHAMVMGSFLGVGFIVQGYFVLGSTQLPALLKQLG